MTVREMVERAVAMAAAQKRVVEGVNDPSAPFDAPYKIDLKINFDSFEDDQRKVAAEHWCCRNTRHRWFRRIFDDIGIARFEFEDLKEATMFWLAH